MKWPWEKSEEVPAEAPQQRLDEVDLLRALQRPDLERDAFMLLYSKLVEIRFLPRSMVFKSADEICVTLANGKESTAFLSNLWIQTRQSPEDAKTILELHLSMFDDSVNTELSDRSSVVPTIKDQKYVDFLGAETKVEHQHLAGDLWIVFAIDLPTTMMSLMKTQREAFGLKPEDLLPLAIENLTRLLPEATCQGEGPWYLLWAGGDYTSSLLLMDAVWEAMAEVVEGDIVVAVPARDTLLFTGSQSNEGLAAIRQMAGEVVRTGHHVISDTLIRRSAGTWVVFS